MFCHFGVTTVFAQPYLQRVAASTSLGVLPYNQAIQIGLFGVMRQSALLVGLLLKLRERFELPFGAASERSPSLCRLRCTAATSCP